MVEAFIVDAVRTPMGRRGGGLASIHPVDMAAKVLQAVVDRTGVEAGAVDDVMLGCVNQLGPQTACIARVAWLAAGLPEHVPGTTIDRRCGSSQQAAHFAAQAVMAGVADLVVAGGVENMSMVPIGSPYWATNPRADGEEFGDPYHADGWVERYGDTEISQFHGAELIAEKWDIDRETMERFALESHQRAGRAWAEDRFGNEVIPVGDIVRDEGIRPDTSVEKMASLAPVRENGRITAALSSQIADGAAAMLIASESAVQRYGLEPLARFHTMTVAATDPVMMLSAPIPATSRAFDRAGLKASDIDLAEVNEAFASVPIAWQKEFDYDPDRLNVSGGAIALGHPLGATGARLMTTLVHEMSRTGARYGLQTMCEGGGQANTTILERP